MEPFQNPLDNLKKCMVVKLNNKAVYLIPQ